MIALVTEDEKSVRRAAVQVLTELGYRIFEAGDADQALKILDEQASIESARAKVRAKGEWR